MAPESMATIEHTQTAAVAERPDNGHVCLRNNNLPQISIYLLCDRYLANQLKTL